ncbi:helix-turn-helix domain-containing protein [Lentzea chajnantorensis]
MTATSAAGSNPPLFYTVSEAARLFRVDAQTVYRAIHDDAFPAVRLRSRYVIPARAVEELIQRAAESGGVVDIAEMIAARRSAREFEQKAGGAW